MTDNTYDGPGGVRAEGDRWRGRLPREHDRRSVGVFDTVEEAARAIADELKRLAKLPRLNNSLAAFGERWLDAREKSGHYRGVKSERNRWSLYVADDAIGAVPVHAVEARDVRQWLARLRGADGAGLAAQTRLNALTLVRGVLRGAVEDGLVKENAADEVRLPKGARARTDAGWTFLTIEEIDALLKACDTMQRSAFTVAIYGGLRAGELWGLREEDVDLDAGVLRVCRSYDGPTKAGHVREVPLLAPMRAELTAWLKSPERGRALRGHVWPGRDGGVLSHTYQGRIHDALDRAKITRRVRLHDLRHTCASHLLQGSWTPAYLERPLRLEDVKQWLGHTDVKVTQRYSHLGSDGIRALVSAPSEPSFPPHLARGEKVKNVALPVRIERTTNGLGNQPIAPDPPQEEGNFDPFRPTSAPPSVKHPVKHLGELARAARDAVLEQRPDVWHRVADLIDEALAVEAAGGAAVPGPDDVLVRRLRAVD